MLCFICSLQSLLQTGGLQTGKNLILLLSLLLYSFKILSFSSAHDLDGNILDKYFCNVGHGS